MAMVRPRCQDTWGVLQLCSSDEDFPNFWSSCSGRFIQLLETASIVSASSVEASIAFLGIRGIPVHSFPGCMSSLIARRDQTRGRSTSNFVQMRPGSIADKTICGPSSELVTLPLQCHSIGGLDRKSIACWASCILKSCASSLTSLILKLSTAPAAVTLPTPARARLPHLLGVRAGHWRAGPTPLSAPTCLKH